jgi:hypothetical protein
LALICPPETPQHRAQEAGGVLKRRKLDSQHTFTDILHKNQIFGNQNCCIRKKETLKLFSLFFSLFLFWGTGI